MAKHELRVKIPQGREGEVECIKWIFESAKEGELELYTSFLAVAECLHVEHDTSERVQKTLRGLLTSGQYLRLVSPDHLVADSIQDLRWKHGIEIKGRGADYLHVASALRAGCTEFITTDGMNPQSRGILTQADSLKPLGLAVRLPSQSTILPPEKRQQSFLGTTGAVVNIRDKRSQKKP